MHQVFAFLSQLFAYIHHNYPDVVSISTNLASVFVLFMLRLIGIDIFTRVLWFFTLLKSLILRSLGYEIVLVYTDCVDQHKTTRSLAVGLQRLLPDKKYKYVILENPELMLRWPLLKLTIGAVIIIVTEVTQFSVDIKKRTRIQNSIKQYCHSGGIVIFGHDVLYRRTKNEILQSLAGCKLKSFYPKRGTGIIPYEKNSGVRPARKTKNDVLLQSLPDKMDLYDKEYSTGDWAADVKFIYVHAEHKDHPLVTERTVGTGVVYWVNSGEHTEEGPARSLAEPQEDFINLLAAILRHPCP